MTFKSLESQLIGLKKREKEFKEMYTRKMFAMCPDCGFEEDMAGCVVEYTPRINEKVPFGCGECGCSQMIRIR